MFLVIILQFMEEALLQGVAGSVGGVVIPGHSGETTAGAGIPASDPCAVAVVNGHVIHGKTGAGGADIGTTTAVVAATGKFFPDCFRYFFFLQFVAGVTYLNVSVEAAPCLKEELIADFLILFFHCTEKIVPFFKKIRTFSPPGSHVVRAAQVNKLEIIAVIKIGTAVCGLAEAVCKRIVTAEGDDY